MRQRLETRCPGCTGGRLVMDIEVNDRGSQTFPDGQVMRQVKCDGCDETVLVTLNGADREPTLTPVPK
jgi:hypothetical protein